MSGATAGRAGRGPIQPNRLSNPGELAARERVEAVYAAVDRLTPDDLALSPMRPPDLERRERLMADLEQVADSHGRGPLLAEARGWLRDALLSRVVSRFRLETGVAAIPASGRAEDQARVFLAIEDAVSVAVAEDLIDPGTAALLADPGRSILGLPALRSLSPEHTEPSRETDSPWAPSARDWAEAEQRADRVDPDATLPGVRGMWVAFMVAAAATGVLAGLAWALTQEEPWIGALIAAAAVALAWTLATFRRAR